VSARAKRVKRDRECEFDPDALPEIKPRHTDRIALSTVKGLVTEPLLTVEIEGKELQFMVDTGTMVSIIQPTVSKTQMRVCDVQARGVTGTELEISGEQIEFSIKSLDGYVKFEHTFIVCPLTRCSYGILGMDFLRLVGAEMSLTSQSLDIDHHNFPFVDREGETPTNPCLASGGRKGIALSTPPEVMDESVGYWAGTVELAETVSVPLLSATIARCTIVRRDSSTSEQVPRKQLVMVDPEGLPGIYMARVVATLDTRKLSSVNTRRSDPLVGKSPLVYSTLIKRSQSEAPQAGTGEHISGMLEGGRPSTAAVSGSNLQAERCPLPV